MIICSFWIILYKSISFIIVNLKTFAELLLGGTLFIYLIDIFRQRIQKKILKKKLTKEIAFELFSQQVVLSGVISDFNYLVKNPTGKTSVRRFSLIIIDALLSSGYFTNFDHKFNDFVFSMYKRLKNIDFELDQFMSLPNEHKGANIKLLEAGKRHSIEAFEILKNSKIFNDLRRKYLKEWLIIVKAQGDLPEGVVFPKDEEIIKDWDELLNRQAGLEETKEN